MIDGNLYAASRTNGSGASGEREPLLFSSLHPALDPKGRFHHLEKEGETKDGIFGSVRRGTARETATPGRDVVRPADTSKRGR